MSVNNSAQQQLRFLLPIYIDALNDPLCTKIISCLEEHGRLTLRSLMIKLKFSTDQRAVFSPSLSKLIEVGAVIQYDGDDDRRYRYHKIDDRWSAHVEDLLLTVNEYRL